MSLVRTTALQATEYICQKMKQFQNNASDIIRKMKKIEEFCNVTLVSADGEKVLDHKVVLASASPLFR